MDRAGDTLSLTAAELQALRRRSPAPAPADGQDVRARNLALILRQLYLEGPLSRPQLARRTGVSVPTAGTLVAELIQSGTVVDLGVMAEARVGKPAAKVAIDATGNVCVVLDLTQASFVAAAVDLDGTIVDRLVDDAPAGSGEDAVEQVVALALAMLERTSAQVIGIGVASPGLVDEHGVVHVADRLQWRDLPLAELLTARTGVDSIVGNDLNLLAIGSRRERGSRDAIVVAIDNGVGAAVVLGGRPVLGEQSAAGEIGHVVMDPDGPACVCGNHGCLDVIVGAPHLSQRVAVDGDAVLQPAGRLLGEVLAPVVSMLNINVIDVLGPEDLVAGAFAAGVRAGLDARLRPAVAAGLEMTVVADDPDFVLLGAAAAVREAQLGVR